MGSVDLKDAYYSVQVHRMYKRFFTCYCRGRYYEFNRMPNGFAQAPLLFTKLLKQPFASLQKQGLLSVVYLDDTYLQGDSYTARLHNITKTTALLTALGFKVNFDKSVLLPAQRIKFLGFILDSVSMTISLHDKHWVRILAGMTIRAVASAIGTIVAALPGVCHGALHYRSLKRAKNSA